MGWKVRHHIRHLAIMSHLTQKQKQPECVLLTQNRGQNWNYHGQNPKDHISFINNGWEPKYLTTRNIYVLITELDYSWKGNTAFCYITNPQIVENENASVT